MPEANHPQMPLVDIVRIAVEEAMERGTIQIRGMPALQGVVVANFPSIQTIGGTVAVNNLGSLQDLVRDKKGSEATDVITSASAKPIASGARQLRALAFCNYQAATLYLQIFGTATAPAADTVPNLPPIPVIKNQIAILDQALLGVDGFGYDAFTVRVSTQPYNYVPTANSVGIWHLTTRSKA
jgi:hypothetical protein